MRWQGKRDRQHYLDMLNRNATATVGVTLAARMIATARLDRDIGYDSDPVRELVPYLRKQYGEILFKHEILAEMEKSQ